MSISGSHKVDREILLKLSDQQLMTTCNSTSFLRNIVCNEEFFKERLEITYPDTLKYKGNETWKNYYLSVMYYIGRIAEFGYNYSSGDPKKQYTLIKTILENDKDNDKLLIGSAKAGELNLVKEAVNKAIYFTTLSEPVLKNAIKEAEANGHQKVAEYLKTLFKRKLYIRKSAVTYSKN